MKKLIILLGLLIAVVIGGMVVLSFMDITIDQTQIEKEVNLVQ